MNSNPGNTKDHLDISAAERGLGSLFNSVNAGNRAFVLIALLSFIGFALHARGQDNIAGPLDNLLAVQAGTAITRTIGSGEAAGFSGAADFSGYEVLYSFCAAGGAKCTDGWQPEAGVIEDTAGNLYGTTYRGGANGDGTVFKVDSEGKETVLHSFCSLAKCGDGSSPMGGVIHDDSWNLYGTAAYGGDENGGTLFKLDSAGKATVLYSFCSVAICADGENPEAGLIEDAAGNLYGTTSRGGAHSLGTVFKVDEAGKETVIYSFCAAASCADGSTPMAGLVQDAEGNLYGTTQMGGANGWGTVFKVDSAGRETVLYSFCPGKSCTDGEAPAAGLIRDAADNLYGTTALGGANAHGTVFKVDGAGKETVIYSFAAASGWTDGANPYAGLMRDAAGNLYGTTYAGGANAGGTAFKVDSRGKETVLYSFCPRGNCAGGDAPAAGLIEDAAGNLYGTTSAGDANGGGTVFRIAAQKGTETSITLKASPNPSTSGEDVTFTAIVVPAPPDGESVAFMEGKKTLGTGALSAGSASFSTSTLKVGTTLVTAVYSGDGNFDASKSKVLKQVVKK
ncbi:MAG: choice-of-anchor tandem repeat GloVer-containing protein [Terriglobales bacterium]